MEGRWWINQGGASGPWTDEAVPVVPCDDAAVERVARRLCAMRSMSGDESDWLLHTGDAQSFLRAAGEVSS